MIEDQLMDEVLPLCFTVKDSYRRIEVLTIFLSSQGVNLQARIKALKQIESIIRKEPKKIK